MGVRVHYRRRAKAGIVAIGRGHSLHIAPVSKTFEHVIHRLRNAVARFIKGAITFMYAISQMKKNIPAPVKLYASATDDVPFPYYAV